MGLCSLRLLFLWKSTCFSMILCFRIEVDWLFIRGKFKDLLYQYSEDILDYMGRVYENERFHTVGRIICSVHSTIKEFRVSEAMDYI